MICSIVLLICIPALAGEKYERYKVSLTDGFYITGDVSESIDNSITLITSSGLISAEDSDIISVNLEKFEAPVYSFSEEENARLKSAIGILNSGSAKDGIGAVDSILKFGDKGARYLIDNFPDGKEAGKLLVDFWKDVNKEIKDVPLLYSLFEPESGNSSIEIPYTYKCTALHVAAKKGYMKLAKLLIEKGASLKISAFVNFYRTHEGTQFCLINGTSLMFASRAGRVDMVRLLIEHGASIKLDADAELYNSAPLIIAAEYGRIDVVKFLLEKGADVNEESAECDHPINKAARSGHTDIVRLLLDNGADIESKDAGVRTPLMCAMSADCENTILLLIEKSANVKSGDYDGFTPLHLAARRGMFDIVKILVNKGADVNACTFGYHHIMADYDAPPQTPLDYMRGKRRQIFKEIGDFLRAHGAKTRNEITKEKEKSGK